MWVFIAAEQWCEIVLKVAEESFAGDVFRA
jgi:hypothetical protein